MVPVARRTQRFQLLKQQLPDCLNALGHCPHCLSPKAVNKYRDTQYTSLTKDKILNSLVYRTLFYVNIYGSYKLSKTVRFYGPPCRLDLDGINTFKCNYLTPLHFKGLTASVISKLRNVGTHSDSCIFTPF